MSHERFLENYQAQFGDSGADSPGGYGNKKDGKKGFGRIMEIFASHPYVPKRVQALRLFANSALYVQISGGDVTGKPRLDDVDKQVSELISVF